MRNASARVVELQGVVAELNALGLVPDAAPLVRNHLCGGERGSVGTPTSRTARVTFATLLTAGRATAIARCVAVLGQFCWLSSTHPRSERPSLCASILA